MELRATLDWIAVSMSGRKVCRVLIVGVNDDAGACASRRTEATLGVRERVSRSMPSWDRVR